MTKRPCSIDHHSVLTSSNLETWLSWTRVSIEDYTSGKSLETRRCPACKSKFRRQVFVTAVVYPIEVSLGRTPVDNQDGRYLPREGWPVDPKDFGLVLRRRRTTAGLTRSELSLLCDVSDSTIRNIEVGRHRPTACIIERLTAVPRLQEIAVREVTVNFPGPALHVEGTPKSS